MLASVETTRFDTAIFAGGGCRCFWQAGFWKEAAPALGLAPRFVGATSAGAAFACAIFGDAIEQVVDDFARRAAANPRNAYPVNLLRGQPVFPHERMYRATIVENLGPTGLDRLRSGPEIRVLLARPPAWLGARSGLAAGMAAYQLDRWMRRGIHPTWARRMGFRGEVVRVGDCRTAEQLADLILHASCTPPVTPLYRRGAGIVLDGGLVDNVPVEAVPEARSTLVLLSRTYPKGAVPRVPGRTYVQPSRPVPVAKWDYSSPRLVRETYDLGRRDGEAFSRSFRSSPDRSAA